MHTARVDSTYGMTINAIVDGIEKRMTIGDLTLNEVKQLTTLTENHQIESILNSKFSSIFCLSFWNIPMYHGLEPWQISSAIYQGFHDDDIESISGTDFEKSFLVNFKAEANYFQDLGIIKNRFGYKENDKISFIELTKVGYYFIWILFGEGKFTP